VEPKAIGTSAAIAKFLGIDWDVAPGLHEHERYNEPFTDETSFQKAVERFYAHPNRVVYGDESADQAHRRFDTALMRILAEDRLETTAVVAHGTVIALWVSRLTETPAFPLWQRLGLPSCVILDSNKKKIIEIIEDVNKIET
jgi:broad specificity phosphatase PhoE